MTAVSSSSSSNTPEWFNALEQASEALVKGSDQEGITSVAFLKQLNSIEQTDTRPETKAFTTKVKQLVEDHEFGKIKAVFTRFKSGDVQDAKSKKAAQNVKSEADSKGAASAAAASKPTPVPKPIASASGGVDVEVERDLKAESEKKAREADLVNQLKNALTSYRDFNLFMITNKTEIDRIELQHLVRRHGIDLNQIPNLSQPGRTLIEYARWNSIITLFEFLLRCGVTSPQFIDEFITHYNRESDFIYLSLINAGVVFTTEQDRTVLVGASTQVFRDRSQNGLTSREILFDIVRTLTTRGFDFNPESTSKSPHSLLFDCLVPVVSADRLIVISVDRLIEVMQMLVFAGAHLQGDELSMGEPNIKSVQKEYADALQLRQQFLQLGQSKQISSVVSEGYYKGSSSGFPLDVAKIVADYSIGNTALDIFRACWNHPSMIQKYIAIKEEGGLEKDEFLKQWVYQIREDVRVAYSLLSPSLRKKMPFSVFVEKVAPLRNLTMWNTGGFSSGGSDYTFEFEVKFRNDRYELTDFNIQEFRRNGVSLQT